MKNISTQSKLTVVGSYDFCTKGPISKSSARRNEQAAKVYFRIKKENLRVPHHASIKREVWHVGDDELDEARRRNQRGIADLAVSLFKDTFVYDADESEWYYFNDNYWVPDRTTKRTNLIELIAQRYDMQLSAIEASGMIAESSENDSVDDEESKAAIKAFKSFVKSLRNKNTVDNILTFMTRGENSVAIENAKWNRHLHLVGVKNGVLNLKTGEFNTPRPQHLVKAVMPTSWHGLDAKAPEFKRFIWDIFNKDKALISFVQRLLGMALLGKCQEHILVIFYGPHGRNGKSTFLELMRHVLGPELATTIKKETLLKQKFASSGANHSADLMSFKDRRLVWVSELAEGSTLDEGRIKLLTGGDPITARAPYGKREITFTPTHTLTLATNDLPNVSPTDDALWARMVVVEFPMSYVRNPKAKYEKKLDVQLPEKLKQEGPGILAWLVRGALAYQQKGLNLPDSVKTSTKTYRKDEDIIQQFIDEICEVGPKYKEVAGNLQDKFAEWQEAAGIPAYKWLTKNKIAGLLVEKGYQKNNKGRHVIYYGIRLRDS